MAARRPCWVTPATKVRARRRERRQGDRLARGNAAERAQGAQEEPAEPGQGKSWSKRRPACAKVEHCFHLVKCLFKHRKTRYRGLSKNGDQLFTLFGFANMVVARRFLGCMHTQVAPA
jgi:IS5 family transposase